MRSTNAAWVVAAIFHLWGCGGEPSPPATAVSPASLPRAVVEKPGPPPAVRADGRLPSLARPTGYTLNLTVDPSKERFSGAATISMDVLEKTSHLVMHARDIHITSVIATAGGRAAGATGAMKETRMAHGGQVPDELVLTFERPLQPGPMTLEIVYDAPFAQDLSGLYRVKDQEHWYAFTQFEATDARRAYPCFDEPGFKTPFEVTVTVPKGMIAVANGPELTHKEDGDKVVFSFEKTPPLPTYLVAFAVGDFDVRQGAVKPVPIRLITAKGKSGLGKLALDATEGLVAGLGEYFDYKYPYSKLDIVAVPDFAAGAMENAGLLTFREELLLLDEHSASVQSRRSQALVIAHELAHQWFGDLVTMQWWNDLWLNEGFATWMETRAVDRWHGAGAELEQVASAQHVMDQDALGSARAVRQPVTGTDEAMEAFDGITYEKGAAVLGMIENWLGRDTFQRGVRDYLRQNAWKNASAEDLLATLAKVSNKDVSAMAATFLDHPGVPSVSAILSCEKGARWNVELRQERWSPLGAPVDAAKGAQTWTTPVCVQAEGRAKPLCADLTTAGPSLVAGTGKCPAWIHPNAAQSGYYRFSQTLPELTALARIATKSLDAKSRLGVVSNLWAQVRAGTLPAAGALKLLPMFDQETDRVVIEQVIEVLYGLSDALVDDAARPAFRSYVSARLMPHKKRLGWKEPAAPAAFTHADANQPRFTIDTEDAHPAGFATDTRSANDRPLLRRAVLMALGELAEDATTLKEAEAVATDWLQHPTLVDGDTAAIAIELASRHAPAGRLDALRSLVKQAKTPQDRVIALRGLASFDDPTVLRRALDLILTDEVKVQDVRYLYRTSLARRTARKVVYDWTKGHWDGLHEKLPGPLAGHLVAIAGSVCTKAERDDAEAFFTPRAKMIAGAQQPLAEALEAAGICVELHAKESAGVTKFFAKK